MRRLKFQSTDEDDIAKHMKKILKQRDYNETHKFQIRKQVSQNQKSEKFLERIKTNYYICECGCEILKGSKKKHNN